MTPRLLAGIGIGAWFSIVGAAQAELPDPVRAMIDAAIATGDETKVRTVIELARTTNPNDATEIDALLAQYERDLYT